jgi:hypothetical protein
MDLPTVQKKLREARFFLRMMCEQELRAFGDKEPFDFFLSAFLSAARSVDYRLRHEQSALYPPWRKTWNTTITAAEDRLMEFMAQDRASEVHEGGSRRVEQQTSIPVFGTYSDPSGTAIVSAPPGTPPAKIIKPVYVYTIDGDERRATEACADFLTLLERMAGEFRAAHP